MSGDDELARTATAASSPVCEVTPLGPMLGRYRLERELGVGAMGVVHAAFDPDLERRVALKVLRSAASGDEARARLLREARAMARLAHPNVVVVHEVGSAGGRDYVAMELVEGTTVDEWLRAAPRDPADIFAVFAQAGRGLAAAHAAGLVHRDFKPHNVLRARDGRVVVTDFGLARGVDVDPDAMATTQEAPLVDDTPSSMTGITRTGSVLGTPAYMAPEQWRGVVGPASDQFAYCVALWEALAHERPFRGDNAIALRAEVERGVAAGELAKLPKRARKALQRGLDPDPARRWPTMDALLAQLAEEPPRNRGLPIVAIAAAACALAAIGFAVTRGGDAPVIAPPPGCPPPVLDPAVVWPAGEVAVLTAAGQRPAATQLASDVERWTAARATACSLGDAGRERRACLDGVLARLDAVARGVEATHDTAHVDAGALLVDPAVCGGASIPRVLPPSRELREVWAEALADRARVAPADPAKLRALLARVGGDPCASAVAAQLAAKAEDSPAARAPLAERAVADAARCSDDRVRADVALAQADLLASSGLLTVDLRPKLQLADATIGRVSQSDLVAELDVLRRDLALRNDDQDEALARGEAAVAAYASRGRVAAQTIAALEVLEIRARRADASEPDATESKLAELRARARDVLGDGDDAVRAVDVAIAREDFVRGRVGEAHAKLAALRVALPQRTPRHVTGHVVDASGAPVANAHVFAGPSLSGDATSAVVAWPPAGHTRETTSDASGAFAFDDAPRDGVVVAEAGARRSWAVVIADDVRLVVEPTSRIEGHIELHDAPAHNAFVFARTELPTYAVIAAVGSDGAFGIDGVPHGDVKVTASEIGAHGELAASARVHVAEPVVGGVQLALPSSRRSVEVLVRSTVDGGPGNAQVILVSGKLPAQVTVAIARRDLLIQSIQLARGIEGEHAPAPVLARARPGDLFATVRDVGEGDSAACAIALPSEIEDPDMQSKIERSLDKLMIQCVPIPPDVDAVVVEVPPWPRLE